MMALFERLAEVIDTPKEAEVLRVIYERMPHLNFSRDLLASVPGETAVMEMRDLWWSDWGSPERILDTLARLGNGADRIAEHMPTPAGDRAAGMDEVVQMRDEEDEAQVA